MDTNTGEWVVYQPPKSVNFGHQSRIRDPRRAWPMVERFITELTDFEFDATMKLTCYASSKWTEGHVATVRIEEARQIFGEENGECWEIGASQFASAVQFALDDDKFPQQIVGPSQLYFNYRFLWNELTQPRNSTGNESRDQRSRLGVFIGRRRLFLQPTFVFPLHFDSTLVKDFIGRIEPFAPFRIRNQYFKRWLPPRTPKTNFGRYLNLEKGWRGKQPA